MTKDEGADNWTDAPRATQLPREAYNLLTQANLLRMRGRWEEAVSLCLRAMEIAPDSSAPQSMLGDIYANQGATEDAVRWYTMALDIDPFSHADRQKLDNLLGQAGVVDEEGAIIPAPKLPRRRTDFVLGSTVVRIASVISGVFVIGIVALAVAHQHNPQAAASAAGSDAFSTPPVLVRTGGIASPPTLQRDPAEDNLLNTLKTSLDSGDGTIVVEDVSSDPRTATIQVTAAVTGAVPTGSRSSLLRIAANIAGATYRAPGTTAYGNLTVRLLCTPGEGVAPSLSFLGDITRQGSGTLPNDMTTVTDSALNTVFTNVWWASTVPS